MIKYNFALLAFLCLASCQDKVDLDELNYPLETIKTAMMELYLASEAVNNRDPEIADSLREVYRMQIELIHDLDLDKVEADILAIKKDSKLYEELHHEVFDSLQSLEKRILNEKDSYPKKTRNQGK